jgi:Ser/Thr protein kinase RdoA (MazF antagonist)
LLTEHVKAFDFNEFEHSFCHGDLHGGNIKYCNNNGIFYDFDFCGYGLISYDIAVFKWMSMLRNNDEIWHEFISGYRSKRNLSENELSPILVFVAIRDIWIMYLFINRVDVLGKLYISQPYIEKRMSFLKVLSDKL